MLEEFDKATKNMTEEESNKYIRNNKLNEKIKQLHEKLRKEYENGTQ